MDDGRVSSPFLIHLPFQNRSIGLGIGDSPISLCQSGIKNRPGFIILEREEVGLFFLSKITREKYSGADQ